MVTGSDLQSLQSENLDNDTHLAAKIPVRNTFVDFSGDDDVWTVKAVSNMRRQQTDSIFYCSSLRDELSRVMSMVEESQMPVFWSVPKAMESDQKAHPESTEEEYLQDTKEDCKSLESVEQNDARVSPEIQAMRDLAANGGGLSGCTTVMMRQIPPKCTQRKLQREINNSGFMGQYDFIYLPMDPRSHTNRGFAFINLVSAEAANQFYKKFHAQYLSNFSAENPIAVLPADLQGFEENALQYASTVNVRRGRTGNTAPIFFRTLPPNVVAKLEENKRVTGRLPYRPSAQSAKQKAAMLQQAKSPAMMKTSQLFIPAHAHAQLSPVAASNKASAPKSVPRFCIHCGASRLREHNFCPYCGAGY